MTPKLAQQVESPRGALDGKTCVITGASRGIGRAIATRLGRSEANVAVNFRSSQTEAADVVDVVESLGGSGLAVRADVSDPEAVERMADRIRDEFGSVDVLINNAGITADTTFDRMTREHWDRVIDVNLGGVFTCTKAFYDDLVDADDGRLINVSSVVGRRGNYGQANYAASKSALFGFSRSLALELADTGTTVNCIAPGYTRTDMVDDVRDDIKERIRRTIPLDRFAEPAEIADVVRFLASDRSSYITGEVLDVNGGMSV